MWQIFPKNINIPVSGELRISSFYGAAATRTPTPTPTVTFTPTSTPPVTPTNTPTVTFTPTSTPPVTPTRTVTPTPPVTQTPAVTPTRTPTGSVASSVQLPAEGIVLTDFQPEGAFQSSVQLNMNSSGTYDGNIGGPSTWLTAGTASNFDLFLTNRVGNATVGAAFNTNLNLGTSRAIGLVQDGTGSKSCTFTMQIRDTGTANVRASCTVSMDVSVGAPV